MLAPCQECVLLTQGSTQYMVGKLKEKKERKGEERNREGGGKGRGEEGGGEISIYIPLLTRRSPFLVLYPKINVFSWIFPGSCLLYSLKFGVCVIGCCGHVEGIKKQIHCLMSHSSSSDCS